MGKSVLVVRTNLWGLAPRFFLNWRWGRVVIHSHPRILRKLHTAPNTGIVHTSWFRRKNCQGCVRSRVRVHMGSLARRSCYRNSYTQHCCKVGQNAYNFIFKLTSRTMYLYTWANTIGTGRGLLVTVRSLTRINIIGTMSCENETAASACGENKIFSSS